MHQILDTLVNAAKAGDQSAWPEIVGRYTPLVRSICRRYGLHGADADDVNGTVWLRLVANLDAIHEPAAIPKWLATTTRHTCQSALRHRNRQIPTDPLDLSEPIEAPADAQLLSHERRMVVQHTMSALPDRDRRLLSMVFSDPPTPYTQISAILGMPVGAIGPTRQRCLARLRTTPAIAALT
jgi:RNA polymerase sigma factor (sigma-70 family)